MRPSIRLVESASASDRLDAARAFIESYPRDREILIVGTSRDAADDLARLIATHRGVLVKAASSKFIGQYRFGLVPKTGFIRFEG